nr:protein-L-isoaspartate(D-aspartate) O-methyltransferase [Sphingomonas kyeonggiensis]
MSIGTLVVAALAASATAQDHGFAQARAAMVESIRAAVRAAAPSADNAALGRALSAVGGVPREAFVSPEQQADAYRETPLPIGYDQSISDPYTVAVMTAAADPRPGGRVLDIGTGSGYQAAVLARLSAQVSSIEIVPQLADQARARLAGLGFANVEVRTGDGYAGWPERAPFDAIIVAAGAARVPQPLLDQLRIGGRLVMPIGRSWATEQILVITRTSDTDYRRCSLGWSMFVPLTGRGERAPNSNGLFERLPLCFEDEVAHPDFEPAPPR